MGFFTPSPLEIKLREQRLLQQQREEIKQQYAAPREQQRQEERAAAAAMKQIESQHAAAVRQLADQEKTAWASWALEPRYTGGHATDPLIVTHHRSGRVPVIVLPPDEAVSAGDEAMTRGAEALIRANRSLMQDEKFMERARVADSLYEEVKREYGTLLSRLRSESWWRGLTVAAGLADKKVEPHLWTGTYSSGKEQITTFTIPSIIGVRVASDGLRVRVNARLGDTPERWRKSTAELRAAFRSAGAPVGDMKIVDGGGGSISICLMDADPLADPLPQEIHPYDSVKGRAYLGRAADGSDIFVTLKNNACVLIAGMQGGGKTASLMPMLAGMIGKVDLTILDGAASGEWAALAPVCRFYDDGGEVSVLGDVMEGVLAEARERMQRITGAGHVNFWDMAPSERLGLGLREHVIVIEEAPNFLAQGQLGKEDKDAAARNMVATGKAVKLVRKAGITLILIAQKPTEKEIPTIIRDMAGARLCFRLDSDIAAATVLGDSAHQEPKPTSIPAGRPGRFVGRVDARGNLMGQAVYVPVDKIREVVAEAAKTAPIAPAPTPTAPGPFAGVEVGGGVTAPTVAVPAAVAEVPVAPAPLDHAPSPARQVPLDIASLTEAERQALLTALLSAPVVQDDGGEAQVTETPEPAPSAPEPPAAPAAPTPDPEPPAANNSISGFDL